MNYSFKTKGVCSQRIDISMDEDIIKNISFVGGCPGNLSGISLLVKGLKAKDVAEKLKGVRCGYKSTSCPDQLAGALEAILEKQSNS